MKFSDRVAELRALRVRSVSWWVRWAGALALALMLALVGNAIRMRVEQAPIEEAQKRSAENASRMLVVLEQLQHRVDLLESKPPERPQVFVLQTDGFQELKDAPK